MSTRKSEKFGKFVRREREARGIGLREMARKIGVSPTYMSKVERDEFSPPAEDKVKAISEILELDADELLALAGKVSSDLTRIIREHPRSMATAIRGTQGASDEEMDRVVKGIAEAMKKRGLQKQ